jgi:hypothetical protein
MGQILHVILLTMSKNLLIPTEYHNSSGYGVPYSITALENSRRIRNQGQPFFGCHAILLYDGGMAFDFRDWFADTLHCQIDFVRWHHYGAC